jgi:hypothetical protein
MQYLDQKHKISIDFLATCAIPACEHKTYIHNEKERKKLRKNIRKKERRE